MDQKLLGIVKQHRAEIAERWLDRMDANEDFKQFRTMPESTKRKFVDLMVDVFLKEEEIRTQRLTDYVAEQMALGWSVKNFILGIRLFKDILYDRFEKEKSTLEPDWNVFRLVERWSDSFVNTLVDIYAEEWENKVIKQQRAIRELSAPLIPVMEGITVMPLIGEIDTERAKYIMENLLNGVIKYEAQVVLIDITGVPVVDTMVAQHIIKAAEAVRLIGSECVLVGIRPEIAQTIVNLGIELDRFPTKSSLRKGILEAMSRTGRKIIALDE